MRIQHHVSLRPYNTFHMDVPAEMLAEVTNAGQLEEVPLTATRHILGGGSNVLLTGPVAGLVLLNRLRGIRRLREDERHVWLEVQAGEVWHEFVLYAIAHNLAGVENLALIPGTVGAAPIQNIGAYGAEVKDAIDKVHVWHWKERCFGTYTNEQCRFDYRDSIFKQELKGQVFISSVVFRLNKLPSYNISYGAIAQELERMGVRELSLGAVAEAVMAIRRSKLPDPARIGNAGSFFKNPVVSAAHFRTLQRAYPGIPSYAAGDKVKIPAGWLIEQCGWKGFRRGDAGVHEKQALVLINYGQAGGAEIRALADEIIASVAERFGIILEKEVQVW
jgi:UDP-N-acetylmuramate dehydrogenase